MSTKRIIFVCSQKGGAGKTTFARALLELLRWEGYRVAAYDTDGAAVGQLLQHEGSRDEHGRLLHQQDPFKGCGYFNIREDDDRDLLLNALSLDPPILLFDLPGGVLGELGKVVDEGDYPRGLFAEYRDAGYDITIVIVMTLVMASVRTIQDSLDAFGDSVDYVAVKNQIYAGEEGFIFFDGCEQEDLVLPPSQSKQALLDHNGVIITMPPLNPRSYALLDRHSLGYLEALQGDRLPKADRARIRQWLKRFDEQIEPARHVLGFSERERPAIPSEPNLPAVDDAAA
ncbi:MAG: hypothetical protein KDK04_03080 [Candidatus Competibacteraceae bacterium]|nr:hypothetical protein [Caldilineaceae bacterium]MCB1810695.1 hypothetical protein [Candidatus Competibacteraceae bacterium]